MKFWNSVKYFNVLNISLESYVLQVVITIQILTDTALLAIRLIENELVSHEQEDWREEEEGWSQEVVHEGSQQWRGWKVDKRSMAQSSHWGWHKKINVSSIR